MKSRRRHPPVRHVAILLDQSRDDPSKRQQTLVDHPRLPGSLVFRPTSTDSFGSSEIDKVELSYFQEVFTAMDGRFFDVHRQREDGMRSAEGGNDKASASSFPENADHRYSRRLGVHLGFCHLTSLRPLCKQAQPFLGVPDTALLQALYRYPSLLVRVLIDL